MAEFGTSKYVDFLVDGNKTVGMLVDMLKKISDDMMFVSSILTLIDANEDDAKSLIDFIRSNKYATRSDVMYFAADIDQGKHLDDPDYFED